MCDGNKYTTDEQRVDSEQTKRDVHSMVVNQISMDCRQEVGIWRNKPPESPCGNCNGDPLGSKCRSINIELSAAPIPQEMAPPGGVA